MSARKELRNEFSWSFSRDYLFRECKRAYFYHYYGSFGGWEPDAPPEVRLAYVLKNLTTIRALVGEVVHRALQSVLRSVQAGSELFPENATQMALALFKTAWRESRTRAWTRSPKRYKNIFEIYYNQVPTDEELRDIPDWVGQCIRNFLESELLERLRKSRDLRWLSLEELKQFECEGVRVFAMPDLVVERGGEIEIHDWKTGKERTDDTGQVGVYGLLAVETLRAVPGKMRGSVLYLRDGTELSMVIGESELAAARDRIRQSSREMLRLLDDPAENLASIENFPETDDPGKCAYCNFKELCGRG